jgi:hypothetical protein
VEETAAEPTMMMSEKKRGKEPGGTMPAQPKPPPKKAQSPATMMVSDLGSTAQNSSQMIQGSGRGCRRGRGGCGCGGHGGRGGRAHSSKQTTAFANGQQALQNWQVQQACPRREGNANLQESLLGALVRQALWASLPATAPTDALVNPALNMALVGRWGKSFFCVRGSRA